MKAYIASKVKKVFGKEYKLASMERILGGAQKYTYLAKCTNGFEFIIYQWGNETTYFENYGENAVFCSSGAKLFQSNNELMRKHGVLTPKLFYMDRTRNECDYDFAFVEYVKGHDMDYIIAKEPYRLQKVLESLRTSIDRLHGIKSETAGQIDRMQTSDFDVISFELEQLRQNSSYLREYDNEYSDYYVQVETKATEYASKLKKRKEYTFIHSELGPNHVIVDEDDNAYLIDIEGAKFYDVEEELSFLDIRFNKILETAESAVDEQRMHFYYLGHCLGNLQGAIELKRQGYYDMDDLNGMIEFFRKQVIETCKGK
ncbi:MAG: phosphotransferase [Clostridia bacterium]|nr:phosphotransferase [Clostridia bacterium]